MMGSRLVQLNLIIDGCHVPFHISAEQATDLLRAWQFAKNEVGRGLSASLEYLTNAVWEGPGWAVAVRSISALYITEIQTDNNAMQIQREQLAMQKRYLDMWERQQKKENKGDNWMGEEDEDSGN